MSNELILVTGATGFVASHIIDLLLRRGYRVRGTVRDLKNEDKLTPIRKLGGDKSGNLELVEADLLNSECWVKATDGCTYVMHTASPFPLENPKNEDILIKPAVDGTLNVLKACGKNVKRVVLTSSVASVYGSYKTPPNGKAFTEDDYTDPRKAHTVYIKSKTLAERAAWDYIKELPVENRFELVVINPSLVLGPVFTNQLSSSVTLIKRILTKEMPMLPRLSFAVVDVRDVAAAHLAAMTNPEAAGKRIIAAGRSFWLNQIAEMIAKEFKPMGYDIPNSNAAYALMWFIGRFDSGVRSILGEIGHEHIFDNSRLVNVLGIIPRDPVETILDTSYSLVDSGIVKKNPKYKPKEDRQ